MTQPKIEERAKKIFPGYLVLKSVTKGNKKLYNIERIRKRGNRVQAIPAAFELLDEKELTAILSAIEKKDPGALSQSMNKIRKKGMFYRMIDHPPADPPEDPPEDPPADPPADPAEKKAPADPAEKKADTEKKIEEPKKQDENEEPKTEKDDQKKDQEKK